MLNDIVEEYITLGHTDWLTLIYRALVMPCHLRSQIFSIVTLLWSFSFLSRNSQDNSHVSQMFIHFYAHLKTMFYFRWHNPPWGAHWAQGGSWRVLSLGRAICAHKIRAAIVCVCVFWLLLCCWCDTTKVTVTNHREIKWFQQLTCSGRLIELKF